MKTAEEILNQNYYTRQDPECDMDGLIKIINEARIECIKECAETIVVNYFDETITADKLTGSVLKLIDQVK